MPIHIHTLRSCCGGALVAILAIVLLGQAYAHLPGDSDLAMVTGRVTLAGSPINNMIICCDRDGQHSLYGLLNNGTFYLTAALWTRGGVPPGRYHVHLCPSTGDSQVPSKYTDPATSRIEIEIVSGWNDLDIAL